MNPRLAYIIEMVVAIYFIAYLVPPAIAILIAVTITGAPAGLVDIAIYIYANSADSRNCAVNDASRNQRIYTLAKAKTRRRTKRRNLHLLFPFFLKNYL